MKHFRQLLSLLFIVCGLTVSLAQVQLSPASSTVNINFSNTTPSSVGTTPASAYAGFGFEPNPTVAGRLNSNAWSVRGFDSGDLNFGDSQTLDDFGRGSVTTGVITPGLYSYTDSPHSVSNPALLIQSGANDFSPGHLILRIQNTGTINMTQVSVSYNLFVRNDESRSSSFKFSHSANDVTYTPVPALDYVSPTDPDAFAWNQVDVSPSRSMVISGINVAPGAYYYIRWSVQDEGGSGERDEFGIDDIIVSGTFGSAVPNIHVKGATGYDIAHMDTTPSVAEGTEFAERSTYNSPHSMAFMIQNLGAAILNVTSVTITGPNAANFTIFQGSGATTVAPVAGSTISYRELVITFNPSFEGLHKARVNIYTNDNTKNPYWFDIQGLGYHPKPDISVRSAAGAMIMSTNMIPNTGNTTLWGTQVAGVGVERDFRIRNEGQTGAPLILTGTPIVSVSGDNPQDFVITQQPSSTSINPGLTGTFKITFNPQGTGIRSAIITIANNDPLPDVLGNTESPYTFKVQGVGIAPEIEVYGNNQHIVNNALEPTVFNHTDFEYVDINGATVTRVYTIRNSGNAPLTLGMPVLSGPHAIDFTILSNPAATVATGAQTTFSVRFDPSDVGQRDAIITFATNDFDENPYVFAIKGNGIDYIPCSYEAMETLGHQNFETTVATPNWNYTNTSGTVAAGTAFGAVGDAGSAPRFIGGRSFQSINTTAVTIFQSINTQDYFNVELYFRLAALSTTNAEGLDTPDRVVVSVSSNGGTSWSDEFIITGNNNTKWSFLSGTGALSHVYDGNNVAAVYNTAAGYLTIEGLSHVRLSNLPRSNALQIRITLQNNSASEIWAIDDVMLFGRKEVTTVWNGSTWSNGVPTNNKKAIIAGNYSTASGNIQACKVVVNSGVTLTINSNQSVLAQGSIENAGNIVIENAGSLVQKDNDAVNSGSILVKRNTTPVRRYDYTYWSSPVENQTLLNLSPNTLSDKYYVFNSVNDIWDNVAPNTIMEAGKGYIIRAPQSHDINTASVYNAQFNGPAHNGIYTQSVFNESGNWNLIGNPYPSALDANAFIQSPSNAALTGTLYFWTHNTPITNYQYTSNDYASYNLLGGAGTGTSAPNTGTNNTIPTRYIASGQGFFAIANTAGHVTFNNGMRVGTNNNAFFRVQESVEADVEKHRLWLNLSSDEGFFRQILVGYAAEATNGTDRGYDGEFVSVNAQNGLYSLIGDNKFTIQGRGLPFLTSDKIELGFETPIAGTYRFDVENFDGLFRDQSIFLFDKYLNTYHDIKNSTYSFVSDAGSFNDRFEIVYETQALGTSDVTAQELIVAVKDKVVQIQSAETIDTVTFIDLLGRNILTKSNVQSSEVNVSGASFADQAIVVKIHLANGKILHKKVILK